MIRKNPLVAATAVLVIMAGGLLIRAQENKVSGEQERSIKEAEVPAPALAALKKLAGGGPLTEFAEEIEHGQKYYEGSWKGLEGNIDALVTASGDVVEIEETITAAKAPASVRAAAEKEAGRDAKVSFEKKTLYLYEIHFKKDGKGREMIFTADGRRYHEGAGGDQDEDEGGEDEDEGEEEGE